jgi:hypothetical protein
MNICSILLLRRISIKLCLGGGDMDIWNTDCFIEVDSKILPGQVDISTDSINISIEKRKIFGLVYDGFEKVENIEIEDLVSIFPGKRSKGLHSLDIKTEKKTISLFFNKRSIDVKNEMEFHIKKSREIKGMKSFSIDTLVRDYFSERSSAENN